MARVLEEVTVKLELKDLDNRYIHLHHGPYKPAPRTPGPHMSDILRAVAIKAKKLKIGEPLEDDPNDFPLLWMVGCAVEEYVASLYPEMNYQPGEIVVDEIPMTPDGVSVIYPPCLPQVCPGCQFDSVESECPWCGWHQDEEVCVEEFKFTSINERSEDEDRQRDEGLRPFLDEWLKLMQGKAYCKGYNTTLCRWHLIHNRPIWQGGPMYRRHLVRFEQKELDQCWEMISSNRELGVRD